MSLSEKAKTGLEVEIEIGALRCTNVGTTKQRVGRDKRLQTLLEEKWVRLEDAQQEIDDCKTSWQNLKDTIPKFDAKICFLETQLKACNRLIDEMQRERGEQKQKLQSRPLRPEFETEQSWLVALSLWFQQLERLMKG